jgi:ubiquinone/menaquinone biosynthesis C-methylase UbiE
MPFDHFSMIAGLYNRMAKYDATASFLDLVALPPAGMLLDAGGGTGRVAEALRGKVKGMVVADVSYSMLRYASGKGLTTVCAPAEKLPFSSNTFDRIIIVDALHHVRHQRDAINELWRVLVPSGKLAIIEPDIHKFPVKLIAFIEKMLLMRSHFLTDTEIASLISNDLARVQVIHNEFDIWVCAEKVREL